MKKNSNGNQNHSSDQRIVLNFHDRTVAFYPEDLSVVSSGENRGTKFFIDNDDIYESSYSFGHFEREIKLCGLLRVHRSYFINTNKFHEYISADEIIVMTNGTQVPLGRKYKPAFLSWMYGLSKNRK